MSAVDLVRGRGSRVLVQAGVVLFVLAAAGSGAAQDLDMDRVFRCHGDEPEQTELCADARELVLNHCTACHTFVPIVMQQFEPAGWEGLLDRHRDRVGHLDDEQVATIQAYLAANFNPEQEPPELPPELLENWTSY